LFLNQSSGTTGNAKTYLLSHQDILDRSERYRKVHDWDKNERFLNISPLHFSVSRASCFFLLQCGATNILSRQFSPATLVEFVTLMRVSYLKLTPSYVIGLLDYAKGKPLLFPDLRAMTSSITPASNSTRLIAKTCCWNIRT
jgi:acyl-coenzyme A synthetase/AMP-(fatty) acid ligase